MEVLYMYMCICFPLGNYEYDAQFPKWKNKPFFYGGGSWCRETAPELVPVPVWQESSHGLNPQRASHTHLPCQATPTTLSVGFTHPKLLHALLQPHTHRPSYYLLTTIDKKNLCVQRQSATEIQYCWIKVSRNTVATCSAGMLPQCIWLYTVYHFVFKMLGCSVCCAHWTKRNVW